MIKLQDKIIDNDYLIVEPTLDNVMVSAIETDEDHISILLSYSQAKELRDYLTHILEGRKTND